MQWPTLRRRSPVASAANRRAKSRVALLEPLETRNLMASLPYGAMPDDTGEFMLGDVYVTVVLMESQQSLSPNDVSTKDWTAGAISEVKARIQQGVSWWSQALDSMENVADGLLNFEFNWTHADTPVPTGYEPINRPSNDFAYWIYDFLEPQGFATTGQFNSDIRAFNNFQREQHDADWAFTIFVVNADGNQQFASGGQFSKAFAFAGGQFMVVPANRPASTYAHETGHMFWAMDEYGGSSYVAKRGYYDTPNTNAAANPGHQHVSSIMSADDLNNDWLSEAYAAFTSSPTSLEMIGWKDSDGDGIFDVLDVPFDLSGVGEFNPLSSTYSFSGTSVVRTLPNQNPSGLGNDITINQIREVQYQIDGGAWQPAAFWDDAYKVDMEISFSVPTGDHEIRIRTIDTKTGVTSNEFIGHTSTPKSQSFPSGAGGFLYVDSNNSGSWDHGEVPLADWALELVDDHGQLIQLHNAIDPDAFEGPINGQIQGATFTVVSGNVNTGATVLSKQSLLSPSADSVLVSQTVNPTKIFETWTDGSRRLKITFADPQTLVNVLAMGSGGASFGRLEAYNAAGELVGRFTTRQLGLGSSQMMSIARPEGDIAYVIAGGHMGTEVLLDAVDFGPKAVITTDSKGAYVLPNLPAGSYNIVVLAPPSFTPTSYSGGVAEFALSAGEPMTDLNFGFRFLGSSWQNTANRLDTNNDGHVTALDALVIINRLHTLQDSELPVDRPAGAMFIDVNADLHVTALDALIVINYLNSSQYQGSLVGGEGEVAAAETPASNVHTAGGGGAAEGESQWLAPARTAAEYFRRQPFHVLEQDGDSQPCMCGSCVGEAIESLVTEPVAQTLAANVNGFSGLALPLVSLLKDDALVTTVASHLEEIAPSRPKLQLLSARVAHFGDALATIQKRLSASELTAGAAADGKDAEEVLGEIEALVPDALSDAWTRLRSRLLRA